MDGGCGLSVEARVGLRSIAIADSVFVGRFCGLSPVAVVGKAGREAKAGAEEVGREGSGGLEGLGFEDSHCASSDAESELEFCIVIGKRKLAQ